MIDDTQLLKIIVAFINDRLSKYSKKEGEGCDDAYDIGEAAALKEVKAIMEITGRP